MRINLLARTSVLLTWHPLERNSMFTGALIRHPSLIAALRGLARLAVLLAESINSTRRVYEALFTRVEWMTLITNVHG